jgi:hypothetical protein
MTADETISSDVMEKQDEKPASSGGSEETVTGDGADAGKGISQRRLLIIVIGLCLTVFLTALDQVFSVESECNVDNCVYRCTHYRRRLKGLIRLHLDRNSLLALEVPFQAKPN